MIINLRPMTAYQTCHSRYGTHLNSSNPFSQTSKRPHSFSRCQSPLTGCYYHYSFQWTYPGPSFEIIDGCYTNRPQNLNLTLAFFPLEHHLQRRLLWQGRLGRQPPDFNFIGVTSNGVISVLRLYSHWVSGLLLVRNTSRLPHLGWLVWREKRRRGDHYSSLLLLASDEALNPVCIQVLRGHWENNTEKQHEWWGKWLQSPVRLHLLLNNKLR